jgi:hypothetical protein
MSSLQKVILPAVIVTFIVGIVTYILVRYHRSSIAPQELANILPQIASITLYDVDVGESLTSTTLQSAISAPFPVDVFMRAASSAQHHSSSPFWKGSSLAILTLRDGTQRHAHISYYGSFFTIDGIIGHFIVPSTVGFGDIFNQFLHQHIIPKRIARNATRNA